MAEELKPCPFCGSAAYGGDKISCRNHECMLGFVCATVEDWNRREGEYVLAVRVVELEGERKKLRAALHGLVGRCRPGWQEVNVSEETINAALEALKGEAK